MTDPTSKGSQVVSALEATWAAIQQQHPDLPDVVLIIGSGAADRHWGYTWPDRWVPGTPTQHARDNGAVITHSHRLAEVFIAGERLALGAQPTFQTVLHEAAHVLAKARGTRDTSNQGRYHNLAFVAIAVELGLYWPKDRKPHEVAGFSAVELGDETILDYRKAIAGLDDAINMYLEMPAGLSTTDPVFPRKTRTEKSRNLLVATCGCETPRKIRVAPTTLSLAPITCGACGEDFRTE